jgi:hypothetical protein
MDSIGVLKSDPAYGIGSRRSAGRNAQLTVWRGIRVAVLLLTANCGLSTVLFATTVTGTVRNADGAGINGKMEFELSAPGRVADPALLLTHPRVGCVITNGAVAGTCAVRGNDQIQQPTDTYYRVRIVDAAGRQIMARRKCTITLATWDVSAAASCAKE